MPASALKVPPRVRDLIRQLPPNLKRKIRAALSELLEDPNCGKRLERELEGLWSLRGGRQRITYQSDGADIQIAAVGPRRTIYEEMAREEARRRNKT
jgi:mRNA-degrading endonuclease RelE of RelBE toxin-antitoxin system